MMKAKPLNRQTLIHNLNKFAKLNNIYIEPRKDKSCQNEKQSKSSSQTRQKST